MLLTRDFHRLPAGLGGQYLVTAAHQHPPGHLPHRGLVLDDQHHLIAALGLRRGRLRRVPGLIRDGQQHGQGGAEPRLGVDSHGPVGLRDDPVHGGQPEAGSLALRLGGEERLEDPLDDLLRYPYPGVTDLEADVAAWREVGPVGCVCFVHVRVGGLQGQYPAALHGIPGVNRDVDQHLLDLAAVGQHRAEIRRQAGDQLDMLTERADKQLLQVGDHVIEAEHARLDHFAAGEGQQLASQRGGPLRGLLHLLDVFPHGLPLHLRRIPSRPPR